MTENKAYVLDIVVGCLATWGAVILLNAVGANGGLQFLVGMWGLVITAFMVGVIGTHYGRKKGKRED
jgi:lipopolysaccharide export LptBFGC system permease protein LptF